MVLALDQSQARGDTPENDTIKSCALIGGETRRNANSFHKAIIFRQFPLHLELTLVQKGLANAYDLKTSCQKISRNSILSWNSIGKKPMTLTITLRN